MAGNFPLAGFHDLICVILTSNTAIIKPSVDDKILVEFFVNYLHNKFPKTRTFIKFSKDKLVDFDKVIATGSNNTFNYFEYYFRDKKSLLRKNRSSIAVLSGHETNDEITMLSDDIFTYFGLGCRSISKILIPRGFEFENLKKNFVKYKHIINHYKYSNNYNYQKTIKIMNNENFIDGDFFILSESTHLTPPISVIYFEYYKNRVEIDGIIKNNRDNLQCIVSGLDIEDSTNFGEAQNPKLDQYADNIDTIDFLLTTS